MALEQRFGTSVETLEQIPTMKDDRERPTTRRTEDDVKGGRFWGVLRISIGWVFLWAFLDRLLALGFSTGRDAETGVVDRFGDAAWINGGSPTEGFLTFGLHTKGVFVDLYGDLAGQGWVDWGYMLSMALIGTALILGVATRLAVAGGILWMVLFYTASAIWPEHNPFMDDHVIYAIALAGIAYVGAGRYLGLGRWWEATRLVQRFPALR
jgi:thiosulfate dehydrogenase [quinone] large subunit